MNDVTCTINQHRRRIGLLAALAVTAMAVTALAVTGGHASAARPPAPVPIAGSWCGVTDSGGSVHFDVSADGRFVGGLTVRESNSGISGSEGIVNPTTGIADGMFIFRSDRDEYHC